MTRALTSDWIAAATAATCRPIYFFEGDFGEGALTLNLCSYSGNITWNSKLWLGNGWLQAPQNVDESNDLGSTGMTITLAGVPEAIISAILSESSLSGTGTLWFGFLNTDGSVVDSPVISSQGLLDVPTIDDQVTGPMITVAYESRLVDLDRARDFTYTPASQHEFNSADTGFRYVAAIQSWSHQWGLTQAQLKSAASK